MTVGMLRAYVLLLMLLILATALNIWRQEYNTSQVIKNRHVTCKEFAAIHPAEVQQITACVGTPK